MTKAIPNFGCKSLLFVVKYTCQPQKSHNCHQIRRQRSGATKQGSVSKWRDALSKQSCELFVAKAGSACPRPDITGRLEISTFKLNIIYAESYRSGHNELDSKSSCGLNRTRVRIPHSPPTKIPLG